MKASGCEVPSWMLALPAPSKTTKKNLKRKPVDRKNIGGQKGKNPGKKEALNRVQMIEASKKRSTSARSRMRVRALDLDVDE